MNRRTLLCAVLLAAATAALPPSTAAQVTRQARSMPAFRTEAAFRAYIRAIMVRREAQQRRMARSSGGLGQAALSAAPAGVAVADAITNNQHAGVDEGGIVKVHGNHLVVLRRGRLFTVAVGGTDLTPVDMVDAFGPGIDPGGAWYDEMLIGGDMVAVIGYSYQRGGTEVGLFRISAEGRLGHVTTFQLRSNDYYSARNYASRLIGTKLVFYAPLYLPWEVANVNDVIPAMRRWSSDGDRRGFVPIASAERVYRPAGYDSGEEVALHTVTSCDLATAEVSCEATVVVGPPGRVFYVSGEAVYVWMTSWRGSGESNRSLLTRIPLAGGAPSAIGVDGAPLDQFSFLEREGVLHVLTRDGRGESMWSAERARGQAALLRLPLSLLSDGSGTAPGSAYRPLPVPPGWSFQNRFVGNHLLYGSGNGWGSQAVTDSTLYVVPLNGGLVARLPMSHGTDRIEVMGNSAVVVGARGGNLEFSGITLGRTPAISQRFVMPQASQGELRSHGFFYRSDGEGIGVLGLPVREAHRAGHTHLVQGSASIVFLRNTGRRFAELGLLEASEVRNANDNCRASCVDWYGNARPIFMRGRVFALLGYEIVEGRVVDGMLSEAQRVSFAPGVARYAGR